MKLSEYLDKLKECNDEAILEGKLKIYDNWPVLLFGNPAELFLKVTNSFRNSPRESSIREPWQYIKTEKGVLERDEIFKRFNYSSGTVEVQINKDFNFQYEGDEHKINGLEHSVWVMFHPYQKKKMEQVGRFKAMALAIVSFGDYVIRENLTARFPKRGLNINHIPE